MKKLFFALSAPFVTANVAQADTKIVVWNMEAELAESIQDRREDFSDFVTKLDPDVIVLVEVNGEPGTKAVTDQLNWPQWQSVTSDFAKLSNNVFFALEMAVISKVPIEQVIEFDSSPDQAHSVISNDGATIAVTEELLSSDGISDFIQSLRNTDRGSLRVDLANGLSIFPIHLKSNRVPECSEPGDALKVIEENGFTLGSELKEQLETAFDNGFPVATSTHIANAEKRERVMAAIVRQAEDAVAAGRIPVLAGDFNTAYEPGKKGSDFADCSLAQFSCEKAPFPEAACSDGDGYDDTLGILDSALIGPTTWTVLSKDLDRTYIDTSFANKAIDHIAVPEQFSEQFATATKFEEVFGSDHFPVVTVFAN